MKIYNKIGLFFPLCLFTACTSENQLPQEIKKQPLCGAPEKASPHQEAFEVAQLAAKQKQAECLKIHSLTQQVVAGIKYSMLLEVKTANGEIKFINATLWYKAWIPELKILKWEETSGEPTSM